jgi:4-phospho-D-threonate 3-dehydrogenase / 4-phospho-D-erythronate 3-dehydrogenase
MKPVIGITMGDPAGIGPEIAIKTFLSSNLCEHCHPLLVGDVRVLGEISQKIGIPMNFNSIRNPSQARFESGTMDVIHLPHFEMEDYRIGESTAAQGQAAFEYIKRVIELAKEGKLDATVTNPINKESLNAAGVPFAGHTEIYAHFTGSKKVSMLLVTGDFRVVHVTTHVALRDATDLIKTHRILEVIKLAHDACLKFGIEVPRIGVAGLNPHSSDGGLFGDEEQRDILPAIEKAQAQGFNVEGPVPPDTLFAKARMGRYDITVAMYHDQGHIPFKMLAFEWDANKDQMGDVHGVNVTLGLPIIRTSVDHGTAFDIAGRGIASPAALKESIQVAIELVPST